MHDVMKGVYPKNIEKEIEKYIHYYKLRLEICCHQLWAEHLREDFGMVTLGLAHINKCLNEYAQWYNLKGGRILFSRQ